MTVQRWSWLIGKTNVSNEELIEWAQTFSGPPSVELQGAALDVDSYAPERRAIRIRVLQRAATITLKPTAQYRDPVFELTTVPGKLISVTVGDHAMTKSDYAWDGHTLWLQTLVDKPTRIALRFE
jgi:hypothetical protein